MNVEVTVHKNDNENSAIKGWASVKFNEDFVVNNITILETKEGNLHSRMPQRNVVRLNEEGLKVRTSDAAFAPSTKEAAKELNTAIIDTYKNCNNKGFGKRGYLFDSEMSVNGAKAYYIGKPDDKQKATVSLDLNDYYVSAAFLTEGRNGGNFVRQHANMRHFEGRKNDKGELEENIYVDDFRPIKSNVAKEIIAVSVAAYNNPHERVDKYGNVIPRENDNAVIQAAEQRVSLEDFSEADIFSGNDLGDIPDFTQGNGKGR